MIRAVTFSPEARDDLIELYDDIAGRGAANAALAYVTRLETRCLSLADYPEQGQARDDIRPGLRLLGFERRTEIAFHVMAARTWPPRSPTDALLRRQLLDPLGRGVDGADGGDLDAVGFAVLFVLQP